MGARDGEERAVEPFETRTGKEYAAAESFDVYGTKDAVPDGRFVIGMDIGGTKIRVGAVDPVTFSMIAPFRVVPSEGLSSGEPAKRIAELIMQYLSDEKLDSRNMRAVSIGLPGSIRNDFSTIYQLPNTAGGKLDGVNLGALLKEHFPGIPVLLNKDVNNLILADIRSMNLKGIAAAVYIGTGIGAAVAFDGQVLYGSHGFAMDVGHMHFYGAEGLCSCGKRGCAEAVASGHVLREINGTYFPDTPIQNLFREHGSVPELVRFVEDCAEVPAAILTVFDPDVLILGGGVIQMDGFPKEALEKAIAEKTERAVSSEGIRIVYSGADESRGITGAAIFAAQKSGKVKTGAVPLP